MANLVLRLPDELHEQLRATAQRNHRSLNGEILCALDAYLREQASAPAPAAEAANPATRPPRKPKPAQ